MPSKLITNLAMRILLAKGRQSLRKLEEISHCPMEENEKLLFSILEQNKDTEFGRQHNFASIHSLEDYRKEMPLSDYKDYEPYIERLLHGEENILYAAKTEGFSRTSGTSGMPKYIPATQATLDTYTNYTWTRSLALAVDKLESNGGKFKPGRGFYGCPATYGTSPSGLPCSNIAEVSAKKYGKYFKYILAIPGNQFVPMGPGYYYVAYRCALEDQDISFYFAVFLTLTVIHINYLKANWQTIVDDIEKGTVNESVEMDPEYRKLLLSTARPMPERAAYLRAQFEQGFDSTIFKRLWPNMVFFGGIGSASFLPASKYVQQFTSGIDFDYSVYAGSEGLYAACYELNNSHMQLLPDSCFFEFIPEEGDESDIRTLDQLEIGKRYEVIITNQSGFYRYRLKDIIEVVDFRNKVPIIEFLYRKGQLVSATGEKFSIENGDQAIAMFEEETGVAINHWILYLEWLEGRARYSFLLECDPGVDLSDESERIDRIIRNMSERYNNVRVVDDILPPVISMLKPGTHDAWKESRIAIGANAIGIKPIHTLDNDLTREFFLSNVLQ